MSKLAEFRELEKHLAEQMAALESLKDDAGLQREIEFEQKLRELLGEYSYGLPDIIALLDPNAANRRNSMAMPAQTKGTRRARQLKRYHNPHTGEVVETKGGNNRQLKQWKTEHGVDVVESWLKA
uniref:Transcriptional regulator MvaT, P16 subunit, putative n=1 Tax=Pseudomonas syringae TaxID=317 RepID=I3W0I0_PSESX|nr:histone-like nucleoid-structuring protein, MvaT/MvaU family [Pseudomonas syringae]AFK89107.1 transcriptional regulator MvaT, P16 subunit, putative [Pseudomonas syringae]